MIYLKTFESLHSEEISNDYYKFVSHSDYRKWKYDTINGAANPKIESDFTESEFGTLRERYDMKGNYIQYGKIGGFERMDESKSSITIFSKEYNLVLTKYNDEWYTLKPNPNYGTMVNTRTSNYVYILDQFEGVLNLLDEFNTKSKLNYWPKYEPWLSKGQGFKLHY